MTVNDLIAQGDLQSVYILARFFYRIGEPILPDNIYDQLERALKVSSKELADYFERFLRRM